MSLASTQKGKSQREVAQEQLSKAQRSLAQNIIEKRWWSLDDMVLRHNGREPPQRDPELYMKSYFFNYVRPHARPNPTDGYMTLHYVPPGSEEFAGVHNSTGPTHGHTLKMVLRVQNYPLYHQFYQFAKRHGDSGNENAYIVGFHGCKTSSNTDAWENILLNNLDPSLFGSGNHGYGAYIAKEAEYCLGDYSVEIMTPIYTNARNELCSDMYNVIVLMCCNVGQVADSRKRKLAIPPGYGAFVNNVNNPTIFCIQESERTLPAYLLLFQKTEGVEPPLPYMTSLDWHDENLVNRIPNCWSAFLSMESLYSPTLAPNGTPRSLTQSTLVSLSCSSPHKCTLEGCIDWISEEAL